MIGFYVKREFETIIGFRLLNSEIGNDRTDHKINFI